MCLVVIMALGITVAVTVAVIMTVMMITATEEPSASEVHRQAQARDRDRPREVDRHACKQTADCLVANQQGNHGEHDGTWAASNRNLASDYLVQ